MAGAYSTIANDGKYIEPTFYTKIDRQNNDTLMKVQQKTRTVFSKEVAYILKQLLTQPVLGENGTATYCKISGVDVAAKTGTTDENYDRWLCGFTPYYTAVTWYGFDENESIEFNQRNPAGLIWANVMSRIHTGLNTARFQKPSAITECKICAKTGKKARTGCTDTYTEYFLWFTEPEPCDIHTGSEVKEKTNTQSTVTEIIKGITNEIDEKEPEKIDNNNTNNDNTNTTNNFIENITNNTVNNLNTQNNDTNNNTNPNNVKDTNNSINNNNLNSNNTQDNNISDSNNNINTDIDIN